MVAATDGNKGQQTGKQAIFIRSAGYTGWMDATYHSRAFLERVTAYLSRGIVLESPIKVSRTSEVYRWQDSKTTLYLKRYRCAGLKLFLQTLFQSNRAQKSWRTGRALLAKGVDTPPPVFYVRRRVSAFVSEHILATREIRNNLSLKDYVNRNVAADRLSKSQRRRFIQHAAAFLAHLHRVGVYHGDLTARNILVVEQDPGVDWRFFIIDLDAIRSLHWISRRRRIKNLEELGRNFLNLKVVSTIDRAVFLKKYLNAFAREKTGFKSFFGEVARRTRYRLVRHGQRFTL